MLSTRAATDGAEAARTSPGKRPRWLTPPLVALAAFTVLLAGLWIPFGFSKTGLIEEWSLFALLDRGESVVASPALRGHETRPLVLLGWALGYWLTPDSFVGLNLVHALLLLVKGLLLYAVVRRLVPANPAFALVAAVLFVVYPADTALFGLRVMNYQLTLALYLLALWLLLAYRERPHVLTLIGLWSALAVGLGTIEVAFPLVFASPLLLVWLEGRLTRRVLWTALLWYLVPVALLIRVVAVIRSNQDVYPLAAIDASVTRDFLRTALSSLGRAYGRSLYGGWLDTLQAGQWRWSYALIAAGVALSTTAAASVVWPTESRGRPSGQERPYATLALVGLAVIGLGFLPYVPLGTVRPINYRTFLVASTGAALTLTSALWLIGGLLGRRVIFLGGAAILIGLATYGALQLHRGMVVASLREQRILAGLARDMPKPRNDAVIVLFDVARQLPASESLWAAAGGHFRDAVRFLYRDHRLLVVLCFPEHMFLGPYAEGCEFRPRELAVYFQRHQVVSYPYRRLVVFRYEPTGDVTLVQDLAAAGAPATSEYEPERLIDRTAGPPRRAYTLLRSWPLRVPARFLDAAVAAPR